MTVFKMASTLDMPLFTIRLYLHIHKKKVSMLAGRLGLVTYDVGTDAGPSDIPIEGISINNVLIECVSNSSCSAPISDIGLHLNICTKYFVIKTLIIKAISHDYLWTLYKDDLLCESIAECPKVASIGNDSTTNRDVTLDDIQHLTHIIRLVAHRIHGAPR